MTTKLIKVKQTAFHPDVLNRFIGVYNEERFASLNILQNTIKKRVRVGLATPLCHFIRKIICYVECR